MLVGLAGITSFISYSPAFMGSIIPEPVTDGFEDSHAKININVKGLKPVTEKRCEMISL